MRIRAALLCAALLGPGATVAAAQGVHHHAAPAAPGDEAAIAAFVAAVRAATLRYHDRGAAIADGFRRLGPDFPAMGEHWVHPGRMVDGTLDVSRPQALSYATIAGRPVLTGVIYARPLRGDEAAPDFPLPGYPWHDHVGAIDEESVLLHHVPTGEGPAAGTRLAMLHAWVWAENPDGVFAADNWALSFVRLGLEAPPGIPPAAARALSLLPAGDAYYRLLFRALAQPSAAQERHAHAQIQQARDRLQRWLEARPEGDTRVAGAELLWLERLWSDLWTAIRRDLDPAVAERLGLLLTP
jgi:hypothetical protein